MKTELRLAVEYNPISQRTVKKDCYFTAPLKIGEPKSSGKNLNLILMMASAGILKGDAFDYSIDCMADSGLRLTEQSYGKLFDMGQDGNATKNMEIKLEDGARFIYRPGALVPYNNSSFDSCVEVHMKESSTLLWSDIFTAGRVAMGEKFSFRHYRSRVRVYQEDKLIWLDQTLLEPDQVNLQSLYYYKDYTHQGTLFFRGSRSQEEKLLEKDYDVFDRVLVGVTQARAGICLRVLANQAQDIEELFDDVEETVL